MKRHVLALALTAAAALATQPGAASAEAAAEVLSLINQQRAQHGCGALTPDPALTRAAQGHAQAMSQQNFFSHTGKNGSTLKSRARAAGYSGGRLAENIAAGWTTPARAVAEWMNSPGHRKNILTCAYTRTGIAMVYDPKDAPLPGQKYPMKYYWVETFGN